jgi:hypothetical protein
VSTVLLVLLVLFDPQLATHLMASVMQRLLV